MTDQQAGLATLAALAVMFPFYTTLTAIGITGTAMLSYWVEESHKQSVEQHKKWVERYKQQQAIAKAKEK